MKPDEIFQLPVHPAADVFPMLPESELNLLAEHIKENGLLFPIAVARVPNGDGQPVEMLIDGRNRREACRRAGIAPQITWLADDDPRAFILGANLQRRRMTKGAGAMAVAMLYPETQYGREGEIRKVCGFGERYLQQARTVLRYSVDDDLAREVLHGAKPLEKAYREATDRRDAASSDDAKLEQLRGRFPDLADKVDDDELTLKGAIEEAKERERQARSKRQSLFSRLRDARETMAGFAASDELPRLPDYLSDPDIRAEFEADFMGDANALDEMVETMEAELAVLKTVVGEIRRRRDEQTSG